jgi:hypothetical protein
MSVEARSDKGFKPFSDPTSARFLPYNRLASWNFCLRQRRIFPRQRVETIARKPIAYCLLPLPTTKLIQQTLTLH